MTFPLQSLVEYKGNMYEITAAAGRRAYQLSMLKDVETEDPDEKVVSVAAHQIFTHQVEFRLEDQT
jgi:DNA-directed RNA polymerase subunit omega